MTSNDFIFLFGCIALCIASFVYGFFRGASWVQKEYQETYEKEKEICDEAIETAKKWEETATRLLQEKYSVVNGGGFRNEN